MDVDQGWWILGLSQAGILSEDGLRILGSGYSPSYPPANYVLANNPSFWTCLLYSKKIRPLTPCPPSRLSFPACRPRIGCCLGHMTSHQPLASA